jgi:SAM-dependent methyltransferase
MSGVGGPLPDSTFEQLLAEGEQAPVDGWDFSWLDGRATEERPRWGYSRGATERLCRTSSVLDIQTGGGEVFAEVLGRATPAPGRAAATEGWAPNLVLARQRLAPLGASVFELPDAGDLPFPGGSFDLVLSRHPTVIRWDEVGRVLRPGGRYFGQHIGPGSNRELTEFLVGPRPVSDARSPERARHEAEGAGLVVVDLRAQSLRVEFFDVGAVVYFLRKVVWAVPDFGVERYEDRLAELHRIIVRDGSFVSHAQRFLIEAKARRGS